MDLVRDELYLGDNKGQLLIYTRLSFKKCVSLS